MEKKGQVTIFIILAIVIVGGSIIVLTVNDNARDFFLEVFSSETLYPADVQVVNDHVQDCLDETLERVIVINSLQGGYYLVPEESVLYDDENPLLERNVPYYYDSRLMAPSQAVLKNEIEIAIEFELATCINSDSFIDGPIEIGNALADINFENFDSRADLFKDRVDLEISFPVTVNFQDSVFELKDFSSSYETNYLQMYMLAFEITDIQSEYENEICLTCINEAVVLAESELVNNEFYENGDTFTIVYNIIKKHPILDEFEIYSFAHRLRR